MNIRFLIISGIISLLFLAAPGSGIYAQTTEEELEQLIFGDLKNQAQENEVQAGEVPSAHAGNGLFAISGFAEFSLDSSMNRERLADNKVYNSEGRIKLKPRYEVEAISAYADLDYYANSGSDMSVHENGSIECNELYITGSNLLIWKAGRQRFNWGSGDAFQPTNYMDRPDFRESFARDNDDRYTGAYALSLKYIKGDYGIELGYRPVTEKALAPTGFYRVEQEEIKSPAGDTTPRYSEGETLQDFKHSSGGMRAGGTSSIFDWHLLYYTGMNRDIMYAGTIVSENGKLFLDLEPVFERVNMFGADLSFAYEKFNARLEGCYSPDMTAISKAGSVDLQKALTLVMAGGSGRVHRIKHCPFASYTAGFDYNLWGDYGTVYAEWMQARYIDKDDITPLLLTDILMIRIEDSFFDQSVNIKAGAMIRTKDSDPGLAFNAELEYNFKNGCTVSLGSYYFRANNDEYVETLEEKDMFYCSLKYMF